MCFAYFFLRKFVGKATVKLVNEKNIFKKCFHCIPFLLYRRFHQYINLSIQYIFSQNKNSLRNKRIHCLVSFDLLFRYLSLVVFTGTSFEVTTFYRIKFAFVLFSALKPVPLSSTIRKTTKTTEQRTD